MTGTHTKISNYQLTPITQTKLCHIQYSSQYTVPKPPAVSIQFFILISNFKFLRVCFLSSFYAYHIIPNCSPFSAFQYFWYIYFQNCKKRFSLFILHNIKDYYSKFQIFFPKSPRYHYIVLFVLFSTCFQIPRHVSTEPHKTQS